MSDSDKKSLHQEEAYSFPEDEYISDAGHEAGENTHQVDDSTYQHDELNLEKDSSSNGLVARFMAMRNRRVVVVVALALLAFLIFAIMRDQNKPQVIEQTPARPVAQQPSLQLQDSLSSLHQTQLSDKGTISQLQSQVSDLKSSLSSSSQSQSGLTQSVATLSAQVQILNQRLAAAEKQIAPKKVVKKKVKPVHLVTYNVKAVVPGRAWLIGSDGSEKTLTLGNHLQGYGVIDDINADSGAVMTSSGKVIVYGTNDN